MLKITAENFTKEVENSEIPVLIDFWADWCGPCKMFAPVLEEFAQAYEGKVKVGKVNVDEEQELAVKFRVMGIPTLILFKNGAKADSKTGAIPKSELETWVKANL